MTMLLILSILIMQTKNRKAKEFDTVKTFREIKENISEEIKGMDFEQFSAYLKKTKLKTQN
jgi:hypothetical protein